MTDYRKDPNAISNYFDQVLKGIGHRGSSFTDVDAVTHDEATDRFLVQEFKRADETLNKGQARMLKGLARHDYITVWCVRLLKTGQIEFFDVASREHATLTVDEYRSRFAAWWSNGNGNDAEAKALPSRRVLSSDINW